MDGRSLTTVEYVKDLEVLISLDLFWESHYYLVKPTKCWGLMHEEASQSVALI